MLQNAYLLAEIGADTAENERNFAENVPSIAIPPDQSALASSRTAGAEEYEAGGGEENEARPENLRACRFPCQITDQFLPASQPVFRSENGPTFGYFEPPPLNQKNIHAPLRCVEKPEKSTALRRSFKLTLVAHLLALSC